VTADHDPDAAPFLPPLRPAASPPPPPLGGPRPQSAADIAADRALDMPFLPEAARPEPNPAVAQRFDAKQMVDAFKRKVENPAYGQLPKSTPESRAALEAARAAMRHNRRRNKTIGWVVGLLLLALIGAAGLFAYLAYRDDQNNNAADRAATEAAQAAGTRSTIDVVAPGPLGEQVETVQALDAVNSGADLGAGQMLDAVDQAKQAVDETNTNSPLDAAPAPSSATASSTLTVADVLPAAIGLVAEPIDAGFGFDGHIVDLVTARAAGADVDRWLATLGSLTQVAPDSPALDVFGTVPEGKLAIGVQSIGSAVVRVIAVSSTPSLHIDHRA
jgi:hypothetical protein